MDLSELALVKAVFNEPEKKALLDEFERREKEAQKAEMEAQEEQAKALAMQKEADKRHADASALLEKANARNREADDKMKNIGQMVEAHNANSKKFFDQQSAVQKQAQEKEVALIAKEAVLEGRDRKLLAAANEIRNREAAVKRLEIQHKAAREHAQRFLLALS